MALFLPWYQNFLNSEQNNPVDNLVEIYNSDYCITLDELPDLKSYPYDESAYGGENFHRYDHTLRAPSR